MNVRNFMRIVCHAMVMMLVFVLFYCFIVDVNGSVLQSRVYYIGTCTCTNGLFGHQNLQMIAICHQCWLSVFKLHTKSPNHQQHRVQTFIGDVFVPIQHGGLNISKLQLLVLKFWAHLHNRIESIWWIKMKS